jgi:hypothetical protein
LNVERVEKLKAKLENLDHPTQDSREKGAERLLHTDSNKISMDHLDKLDDEQRDKVQNFQVTSNIYCI